MAQRLRLLRGRYFAYFENGKIRLISEGYPTSTARDTGVASVEKNIKLPKRYDYRGPFKNGKYDYRLKAGNGKEIARSIWYGSAAAAATGAAYLMGTRKRPVKKAKPKAAPIVAAAAVATASAAPAMAKKAAPVPPRDKDDDYLNCEAYHGHKVTDLKNNVAFFSHENNKEYFVVYDENGDVAAPVAAAAATVPGTAAAGGMGLGWLKWLLPLLLLLLLAFFGLKGCNDGKAAKVTAAAAAAQAEKLAADKAMAAKKLATEKAAAANKGVLGYGEFHGMAYSQLNVRSSRDLEAFRVRAANGTDIHFMKSCGNYMYVCN